MYPSKAIANYFLDKGEEDNKGITPMMLNKLVFLAHGWYLAISNKPLIKEYVEAWDYGPVISELYHEFKSWGGRPIGDRAMEWKGLKRVEARLKPIEQSDLSGFLDRVWEVYKNYDGFGLSTLTHEADSPWYVTVYQEKSSIIPNKIILDYYQRKLHEK